MKVKTRAMMAIAIVGVGLLVGSQLTGGGTADVTSIAEAPPYIAPNVFLLIPTTVSISVSSLNGSAYLIVAPLTGNVTSMPPIVNVSVVQKDIVTFTIPTRAYYNVELLTSNGSVPAYHATLTEGGMPPDQTLYGAIVFVVGVVGVTLVLVLTRRRTTSATMGPKIPRQPHQTVKQVHFMLMASDPHEKAGTELRNRVEIAGATATEPVNWMGSAGFDRITSDGGREAFGASSFPNV